MWPRDPASYGFAGVSPSSYVTTLPSLMLVSHVEVPISCFYFVARHHVTASSKRHLTWRVEAPHPKSPTYQASKLCVLWKQRWNFSYLSSEIMWQRDKVILLCGWKPFTQSYHSAKFDAYRSCVSGYVTFLFLYVTSSDHMIIGPYDLVSGSFSP